MKLADMSVSFDTIMLASIFDKLNWIAWAKTEDGRKNQNHPKAIVSKILGLQDGAKELMAFDGAEDYERARAEFRKE